MIDAFDLIGATVIPYSSGEAYDGDLQLFSIPVGDLFTFRGKLYRMMAAEGNNSCRGCVFLRDVQAGWCTGKENTPAFDCQNNKIAVLE